MIKKGEVVVVTIKRQVGVKDRKAYFFAGKSVTTSINGFTV